MLKYIPNTLTALNMVFGFFSILASFSGDLVLAGYFVFIAGLFDFSDGLAARLLKAYSEIGKQLDSLADLVSFGVAPSIILFCLINRMVPGSFSFHSLNQYSVFQMGALLSPALIVLGAGFRLAKFNIDKRQSTSFLGLPTPASGLFLASLPLWTGIASTGIFSYINSIGFYVSAAILLTLLMVLEVPMFSLKIHKILDRSSILPLTFVCFSVLLLMIFSLKAIIILIILYIFISLIRTLFVH